MSAALQTPDHVVVHRPDPGQLARSVAKIRARELAVVPDAVEPPPAREFRPAPGQPEDTPAMLAARQAHADCSRGAHEWVTVQLPTRGALVVCLHCPVPAHQAAAVRAAVLGVQG